MEVASSRPARRSLLLGGGLLGAGALGAGALALREDPRTEAPLLSASVAIAADGRRHLVGGDSSIPASRLRPGTRLLASVPEDAAPARRAAAFMATARPWLDTVPAAHSELAASALADLWVLGDDAPAPVAGWSRNWRYLWPRDGAFCAVALARAGLYDEALGILSHLQSLQREGSWFEARYDLATGRAPDDRPPQFDGTGLVLWAVAEVLAALPTPERRATAAGGLERLVTRSRDLLRSGTGHGEQLPPVSPDYWELRERSVTLALMATTLAGWKAAATVSGESGDAEAAEAFAALLREEFGPAGYQRYARRGGADSALALLAALGAADVVPAADLTRLGDTLRRPAGGIAPGARWKRDGISWTPSTSLLALGLARTGADDEAGSLLTWLAEHRTAAGSLSEKVLFDGRPAAVAPLAWTAANTILTIDALREG